MSCRGVVARWCVLVACTLGAFACGCAPQAAPDKSDTAEKRDVQIRLLVVDDHALASAIDQLRSEWKARSGATLSIVEKTADELLAGQSLADADAVVYPSRLLGTLAERGWIARLPHNYAQDRELAWSDTFELLQLAETRWGQSTMAVPLGSPVFTCYYRPDLLEKFHRRPPRTWQEYHELAAFFDDRKNLGDAAPPENSTWHGCAEPLAPGWAGRMFLARAAPMVKHRDHYSTLFNIETMEPLIGGAGFVRALEELVADSKLGPDEPLELDPDAVRETFLHGQCALAISWPAHAVGATPEQTSQQPVAFIELPGSAAVYNYAGKRWEERPADENVHIPLLCVSGRLASLVDGAAEPEEAFRLLAALSGRDWGGKIGYAPCSSASTTLYRGAQIRAPQSWFDADTDVEAARQYAGTVRDALSHEAHLIAPRIPGADKYIVALDAAVAEAVSGSSTAEAALAKAAAEWIKITDELGRDKQRAAYRKSLGLDP